MEKEFIIRLHKNFEDFVHNEEGVEFWYARDIQPLLAYTEWRNFEQVIQKAKLACINAGQAISDHFVDVNKVIKAGKGDAVLFGGHSTGEMKSKLNVPEKRPLKEMKKRNR